MKKFIEWVTKVFVNPWYIGAVAAAFISIISFFQIDSARADKNNLNGFWLVVGIVFIVGAAVLLYKANDTSAGRGG